MTESIKAELQKMEARRSSLAGELEAAARELSKAREAVMSGKAKTPTLIEKTTAHNSIAEVLAELDARITAKRGELAASQAADARRETIAAMVKIAAEGADFLKIETSARAELTAKIQELAGLCISSRELHFNARLAFLQLVQRITPAYNPFNTIHSREVVESLAQLKSEFAEAAQAAGVDAQAIRTANEGRQFPLIDVPYSLPEVDPVWGRVVALALAQASQERYNQRLAEEVQRRQQRAEESEEVEDERSA